MFGMGKKKKLDVQTVTERARIAYVTRKGCTWEGHKLGGTVQSAGFRDVLDLNELVVRVDEKAGGGDYTTKLVWQDDPNQHAGTFNFSIEGDPRKDGIRMEPRVREERKKGGADAWREKAEEEKAKREAMKEERVTEKTMQEMDGGDGAGNVVVDLATRFEALEQQLLQKQEEDKWERRFSAIEQRIEGGGGGNSTLEAMKMIMQSQGDNMTKLMAMIESNRKESLQRSEGATSQTTDLFKQMLDMKTNQGEQTLNLGQKFMELGMAAASGKSVDDMGPKSGPEVIASAVQGTIGDIAEMVRGYLETKKDRMSPEQFTDAIRQVGKEAGDSVRAQLSRALPAPTATGDGRKKGEPKTDDAAARDGMNALLREAVATAKAGELGEDSLLPMAQRNLPPHVLGEMAATGGDPVKVLDVADRYGDDDLVAEAVEVFRALQEQAAGAEAEAGAEDGPPGDEVPGDEVPEGGSAPPAKAPARPPRAGRGRRGGGKVGK